ncbi:MAG: hypothetical protein ACRDMX_06745 [Solirubrobacteraceae bacterium]
MSRATRLRHGEVIAGLAAIALVVLMLATGWRASSAHATLDGWHALPVLRWALLITAAAGLALAATQVACRAPALPSCVSVVATTLGALTTVWLAISLAVADRGPQAGAWAGLAVTFVLTVGAFRSLRQEEGWVPGPERQIETLSVGSPAERH